MFFAIEERAQLLLAKAGFRFPLYLSGWIAWGGFVN
jgi:hypothetical protein